jgi:hypothetical protein
MREEDAHQQQQAVKRTLTTRVTALESEVKMLREELDEIKKNTTPEALQRVATKVLVEQGIEVVLSDG